MSKKRVDLQLAIADIVGRRYGVQVTGGNQHGLELLFTWKNAAVLLQDLRRLDDLEAPE
jgi:hypothetical protein